MTTHLNLVLRLLVLSASVSANPEASVVRRLETDEPRFHQSKAVLSDETAAHESRESAIRELILSNAQMAGTEIAAALGDKDARIARAAADALAELGDPRGLDWQAACVESKRCTSRHSALRLLGNSRGSRYRPAALRALREAVGAGEQVPCGLLPAERQALLLSAALALARMGDRSDDSEIVMAASGCSAPDAIEALGYLEGNSAAAAALWESHRRAVRIGDTGSLIRTLVSLSRIGDSVALGRLRDTLRGDGPLATASWLRVLLRELRPRDGSRLAADVFALMAREPETEATYEAWRAMGVMAQKDWSRRVFDLAMTRKPHWKLVSRQMLHDVVMALDPDLNDAFWKEYSVQVIPTHSGQRALVKARLGYLMFTGTGSWTGD